MKQVHDHLPKIPKTVSDYIAQAPNWARPTLRELRKAIKASAPKAAESISYRMPYYAQDGRLAYFGAYKNHCSFHWISAEDRTNFAQDLANQKVVGSTLQIPQGTKVPAAVIGKIVSSRVKNNEARKRTRAKALPPSRGQKPRPLPARTA